MNHREVKIGNQRYTKVVCTDEPGAGGACHEYQIMIAEERFDVPPQFSMLGHIRFQNGAIKEAGVNGCMNEDLIAIVLDRLYGFQSGEFACDANAMAIEKLEAALLCLNNRTAERQARGVEGTLQK